MLEVNEINLLEGLNVIEKIYLNINEREITRNNKFANVGNIKEISEFPSYYVSDEGKVYSTKSGKTKELKAFDNGRGYLQVCLCKEGKIYTKRVHRLVLETFQPIPDMQNYDCNHISENKTDNRLSNLNWMTHKENINYGTRNEKAGKAISANKERGKAISKANSKKVLQYDQNYSLIASYSSATEAGKAFGITAATISNYCHSLKLYKNKFFFQYANS